MTIFDKLCPELLEHETTINCAKVKIYGEEYNSRKFQDKMGKQFNFSDRNFQKKHHENIPV